MSGLTDDRLLAMLRLRDQGQTFKQIGDRFGMTRSAVSGALFRIDRDSAKAEGEA